jgi:hypothetical protein
MKFYWIGWSEEAKRLYSGDGSSMYEVLEQMRFLDVDLNNKDSYSVGTSIVSVWKGTKATLPAKAEKSDGTV